MSPVATRVSITRPAGQIGAEIGGVNAVGPLPDEVVAQVRQALLDHKVIFLRHQRLATPLRSRSPGASAS